MLTFFVNWRTTCMGIAMLMLSAGFLMGRISAQDYVTALGVLTGAGMLLAKDSHAS